MQHLPPSSIYREQNVKANFLLWTASLKNTSLTFPSVTPQTAVSSCLTYGCPLDLFTPHFSLWQHHCAPAVVAPISLSLVSHLGEKQGFSCFSSGCLCMARQANVPHGLIPTLPSSSETNTGCQIQLRNRMFHCGGNTSIRPHASYSEQLQTAEIGL